MHSVCRLIYALAGTRFQQARDRGTGCNGSTLTATYIEPLQGVAGFNTRTRCICLYVLLRGRRPGLAHWALCEYRRIPGHEAPPSRHTTMLRMRTTSCHMARAPQATDRSMEPEKLYDLDTDPQELVEPVSTTLTTSALRSVLKRSASQCHGSHGDRSQGRESPIW